MIGLAIAAILLGYSLVYTGIENLTHGGEGHTLWQNMGITTTVDLGDPVKPNQSGSPPVPDFSLSAPLPKTYSI